MLLFKIKLLLDFGLVILIWMVQLIIYPSFQYYTPGELIIWHGNYTTAISIIVIPLMLGQLFISILQCFRNRNFYTIANLTLVCLLWVLTFTIFVPIHKSITNGVFNTITLESLVLKNWSRTFLWSALFILSIYKYLKLDPINFSTNSS